MPEGRVRISLADGELEVEGTTAFINQYDEHIEALLARLRDQELQGPSARRDGRSSVESNETGEGDGTAADAGGRREFGELLHRLSGTKQVDQVLLAGWHAQNVNGDNAFSTREANTLLIDQGIKVTNAAQAMRQNLSAKRVFKVSGGRWRLSKPGEAHLRTLGAL